MTVIGVDARPEFDSRGDECVVVRHVRHSVKDSRHFIQFASDLGVGARISIAESSLLVTLFTLLHFRCCMLPNSDFKYSSRSVLRTPRLLTVPVRFPIRIPERLDWRGGQQSSKEQPQPTPRKAKAD